MQLLVFSRETLGCRFDGDSAARITARKGTSVPGKHGTVPATTWLTRRVCAPRTVHRGESTAKRRSDSFRRRTANAAVEVLV